MKQECQGSRRVIWYVVLWIATGSFRSVPMISSAFLQDSRTSKPPPRNLCEGISCDRSIAMDPMRLLRKHANSFGSISPPYSDDDHDDDDHDDDYCSLPGESFLSSLGNGNDMLGTCCQSLAHGILCPETVTKMEQTTQGGRSNRAVKAFLDRYRRQGPMSCMELLSDPEILPHLTMAMRGLA